MSKKNTMKAAYYEKKGVFDVRDIPVPQIKNPTDILIKVQAISICGTDVRALAEPAVYEFHEGIVVGHECVAIVEDTGTGVTTVKPGDRVVIHPNVGCGGCYYCRTGKINLCADFQHLGDFVDGVMAEYAVVPERQAYIINDKVPSHLACLAEPLACVLNGTTTVRVHPGETVLVLGAGPIGLLFAMLYKAAGATVIVSDIAENRGKLALDINADYYINPQKENLEERVKEITGGIGADIVTDAVGVLLEDGIKNVKKGGDVLIFGLNSVATSTLHPAEVVMNEIKVHGTYIAKGTFPMAVKILENEILPIDKIVTHRLPIEEVKKGLQLMKTGEGVKVIIEM